MRRYGKLFAVLMALSIIVAGCNVQRKPFSLFGKRPGVSGFYVNDPGGFDSLASLRTRAAYLNEVYPLWYHVRPDGTLNKEVNQAAITAAKKSGVKVLPLVNVVPSNDAVLVDPVARDRAIGNIISEIKTYNYDGVNIDFEFVPDSNHKDFSFDRSKMTDFMRRLDGQLKKLGKESHMCVLPHIGVSPEMSGVYDYSALAPYVDKVTIMTYDHSQEGSPPGPLAPFSWVEQNIKTAIAQGFKPSQICLGVATYGYNWPAGKSGGFSSPTRQILREAAMRGIEVKWSDRYQEPYYIYTGSGGEPREVWFENENTLQTKIDLVRKYKLTGVCIWRLGFENERFWKVIDKNFGKR